MNKVILIGRLTKDPELKYVGAGNKANTTFYMAVDKYPEGADFINVVVWNKQAENVKKYCSKGNLVAIDGRMSTRSYDNQDGKKVYVTEVIADNVQFLETKPKTDVGQAQNEVPKEDIQSDPFAEFGDSIELSEDDIAF